jgi:hypothetical protein
METRQAPGPLAGLKVIEMGQLIAGPFAAKTLADFGADVVKIEPPGAGDPLRNWRLLKNGTSVWWQVQSRNKRSVALDLKKPEGQEIVRKLAAEADVLIENFRPGALEGWGLDPQQLVEANPKLVVLRISGYGQTGPTATVRASAWSARRWAAAPPHGRAGPHPGARGREHRRHAGGAARRDRHPAGAAGAAALRPGPGDRRRAVRGRSSTAWKACCPSTAPSVRCAGPAAAPCPASRPATPTCAATAAMR